MFKKFKGKLYAVAPASALALVAPSAFASAGGVNVSGVTSAIEGAAAPIAAIGGAVLLILVGIKVYKWVRRAM